MLGTGTRNFAAVYACGVNQVEAIEHLQVWMRPPSRLLR